MKKTDSENLYATLKLEYNIICYVDIAELLSSHKKIFEFFESYKKSVFAPEERLILYSSEYLNQALLDHIQRSASKIDISNFFVLICNNYDISERLKVSNEKYGYDDVQIRSLVVNLEKTKTLNTNKIFNFDTMCPFPFSMATISTDNSVAPCCKFCGTLGNLNKTNLLDIFYGEKINLIRDKMKNGEKPDECKVCWDNENSGTTSFRKLGLLKYEKSLDREWLDDIKIRDLTISPSIVCNFKCRICSHHYSSSIATEKIKNSNSESEIAKIKDILKSNLSDNKQNKIVEALDYVSESVEFLHIMGGEPFMYPYLESTLDTLIKSGYAKKISLEFNSNGSIFPEKLIDKFKKFKSVEILFSIDDIGKRFEIQRGAIWEEVFSNIQKFKNLDDNNIKIKIAITVNIQNLLYLDQISDFFSGNGMDILWWYLEEPYYYCIDNINEKTQRRVIEKYLHHPDKELRKIAERVKSNSPMENKEFLDQCKKYDNMRNQDFFYYHQEIIDLMTSNRNDDVVD